MSCPKGKYLKSISGDSAPPDADKESGYITNCVINASCDKGYKETRGPSVTTGVGLFGNYSPTGCIWPTVYKVCTRDWSKIMTKERKKECCTGEKKGIEFCHSDFCPGSTKCKPYAGSATANGTGSTDNNSNNSTSTKTNGSTSKDSNSKNGTKTVTPWYQQTTFIAGTVISVFLCILCILLMIVMMRK